MPETFHSSLLSQSPIPILVLDGSSLAVQLVNSSFLEISGFEELEVVGTGPPFPWEGDSGSSFLRNIIDASKDFFNNKVVKKAASLMKKNGEFLEVELTISSIKGDQRIISYLITVRNITLHDSIKNDHDYCNFELVEKIIDSRTVELEKAYAALQQELAERMEWENHLEEEVKHRTEDLERSRYFWERLFQESPEGVVFLDENDCIIQVNNSFCEMFGYDGDKIKGNSLNDLVGKASGVQIDAERMSRKLFNDDWLMCDAYRTHNDGSLIPVSIHASSFDVEGKKYAYCGYRNISERKQNEEQLKYHSKMQSLMAQISYGFLFPSDNLNDLISDALKNVACFFQCTMAGLVEFNDTGEIHRLLEWNHRKQPTTLKESLKEITVEDIPWLCKRLSEDDIVIWDSIRSSNMVSREERDLHVKALKNDNAVFYPLLINGYLRGFVAMGRDKSFSSESTRLTDFYVFCSIISAAIERHKNEQILRKNYETLHKTFENTIKTMGDMLRVRDPYTAAHQKRVAILAEAIGSDLGLGDDVVNGLRIASLVHDVGKIKVPTEILNKPGLLSSLEFEIIKEHSLLGQEILSNIDFPWPVATIVVQHHERIDGSGYPHGLKGDQILMESKVLAVADVVEAMSSHRPYRPGLGLDVALGEIRRGRGLIYDEKVVDSCLALLEKRENLDFLDSD